MVYCLKVYLCFLLRVSIISQRNFISPVWSISIVNSKIENSNSTRRKRKLTKSEDVGEVHTFVIDRFHRRLGEDGIPTSVDELKKAVIEDVSFALCDETETSCISNVDELVSSHLLSINQLTLDPTETMERVFSTLPAHFDPEAKKAVEGLFAHFEGFRTKSYTSVIDSMNRDLQEFNANTNVVNDVHRQITAAAYSVAMGSAKQWFEVFVGDSPSNVLSSVRNSICPGGQRYPSMNLQDYADIPQYYINPQNTNPNSQQSNPTSQQVSTSAQNAYSQAQQAHQEWQAYVNSQQYNQQGGLGNTMAQPNSNGQQVYSNVQSSVQSFSNPEVLNYVGTVYGINNENRIGIRGSSGPNERKRYGNMQTSSAVNGRGGGNSYSTTSQAVNNLDRNRNPSHQGGRDNYQMQQQGPGNYNYQQQQGPGNYNYPQQQGPGNYNNPQQQGSGNFNYQQQQGPGNYNYQQQQSLENNSQQGYSSPYNSQPLSQNWDNYESPRGGGNYQYEPSKDNVYAATYRGRPEHPANMNQQYHQGNSQSYQNLNDNYQSYYNYPPEESNSLPLGYQNREKNPSGLPHTSSGHASTYSSSSYGYGGYVYGNEGNHHVYGPGGTSSGFFDGYGGKNNGGGTKGGGGKKSKGKKGQNLYYDDFWIDDYYYEDDYYYDDYYVDVSYTDDHYHYLPNHPNNAPSLTYPTSPIYYPSHASGVAPIHGGGGYPFYYLWTFPPTPSPKIPQSRQPTPPPIQGFTASPTNCPIQPPPPDGGDRLIQRIIVVVLADVVGTLIGGVTGLTDGLFNTSDSSLLAFPPSLPDLGGGLDIFGVLQEGALRAVVASLLAFVAAFLDFIFLN